MSSRSVARSTLGWAFGMAVSILFLSLWGRSVVVDTDTLAESLSPLAGSGIVREYLADWLSTELLESGAEPESVGPTVEFFFRSSKVAESLDQFVVDVVHAAASSDPAGSTIDMSALVGPAAPELTMGLNDLGYSVSESGVSEMVEDLDPLLIRQPGSEPLVGPGSAAAARLGTAALVASLALVVFGVGFVSLSEDRIAAVRNLMTRVAVGGLSFAVFLRVGSWVLDPRGGRAPVPETVSALMESKWVIPLEIALVTAVVAAAIYGGRRLIRRVEVSPSGTASPTPPRERPMLRSESR